MTTGRIGVDESGKGDYFGPLVVASCYVGPEHEAFLEGVRDSKTLTDKRAHELSRTIQQHCPHTVLVVMPERYNQLYSEIKNLNRLLEWAHAKVIESTLEKQPCDLAISDRFADPRGLQRKLDLKGLPIKLESRVCAESDLAVAAASILARAEFLARLHQLSEQIGYELPKGAGPPVLRAGKELVKMKGVEVLRGVAKLHFKTTQQLTSAA